MTTMISRSPSQTAPVSPTPPMAAPGPTIPNPETSSLVAGSGERPAVGAAGVAGGDTTVASEREEQPTVTPSGLLPIFGSASARAREQAPCDFDWCGEDIDDERIEPHLVEVATTDTETTRAWCSWYCARRHCASREIGGALLPPYETREHYRHTPRLAS